MPALIGRKLGMTRIFDEADTNVPVTVIGIGSNFVSQVKSVETDGYNAVQLAFEDIKARNSTMPVIGHDAQAGLSPKRFHREVRLADNEAGTFELGQELNVDVFDDVRYVDVIGTSKGKGFAGGMKRWGFKGQPASHGTERKHRSPGSVGGHASDAGKGRPKKGQHKAGHLGHVRVTARSLKLVAVDKQKNLLLVKGPVPGPNRGMLIIREAVRLAKGKAKLAAAS